MFNANAKKYSLLVVLLFTWCFMSARVPLLEESKKLLPWIVALKILSASGFDFVKLVYPVRMMRSC